MDGVLRDCMSSLKSRCAGNRESTEGRFAEKAYKTQKLHEFFECTFGN